MTDLPVDPTPQLDPKAEKARLKKLRPWYKKKRFVIPLAIVALITFSSIAAGGDETDETASVTKTEEPAAEAPEPTKEPEPEPTVEPVPVAPPVVVAPNFAAYPTMTERNLALLVKNPDASVGKQIIIYASIFQFDSATGTCSFLANISHQMEENSFDYEANAMFTAGDGASDCPILDAVVEGDGIKVWVTSMASYSYDTQAGGNTTVPVFDVQKLQILPKTEY